VFWRRERQDLLMADHSDELLFTGLNQRIERVARFSAAHPLLTDALLAFVVASASVVGLAAQGRVTPAMLGFCAALCLPLLLRHRDPRLAFGGVALVALVQWAVSGPQLADAAVLVALYWVCLECNARAIMVAAVVVEVGAIMLALSWEDQVFRYWVGVSGLGVAAAALGLMIRQRRELLLSLQEKAARLEFERDQQAELATAAERARIAREMHDIVSHNLTVMIALADGARYALDTSPAQAVGAIERLAATGREALLEMRRLLGVLRDDSARGSFEPQPTLERLDDLISRVDAAGIPVTISLDGALDELAPGIQLTVFRVVQEALTNTLKHADRPTSAHLDLRCRGGEVEVDVTNAGTGEGARPELVGNGAPLPASDGRGLWGMRERANVYGGQLAFGPTDDGGWRVHMRLRADNQASKPRPLETAL
jgi:signal transduction histidine kinase